MKQAHYVVIRYIADPARNEALNVGILVWSDEEFRLRIDHEATLRVIRDHPWLERDALAYLEPHLRERLNSALEHEPLAAGAVARILARQKGFPVLLTEPRTTTILEEGAEGLDSTTMRLLQRIVIPRRRRGGGGGPTPFDELARPLRPLIRQGQVYTRHPMPRSRSGVPRVVDFYVNSVANLALDAIRLSVQDPNEIRLRADAEAFKIEDILLEKGNRVERFIAYCQLARQEELHDTYSRAFQVLTSAGAEVVTTAGAAVERVEQLVRPR
jgi:hypothetical protein